jgi:predicted transcriptional regulator
MTAPVTINFEERTLTALDALAARSEQSRSALVNLVMEQWLAAQAWEIAEIEGGIADADAGRFAGDEEVAAIFAKHGVKYGSGR